MSWDYLAWIVVIVERSLNGAANPHIHKVTVVSAHNFEQGSHTEEVDYEFEASLSYHLGLRVTLFFRGEFMDWKYFFEEGS